MSIDLDAELERQLAKSPAEVRASLAAQGYDVAETGEGGAGVPS